MEQEERIEVYTLPPNFAEEGTVLSGRLKTRNVIETAVVMMVFLPMIIMLPVTMKSKLYIGMIFLLPIAIFCILGVQGQSLFAFVSSVFVYVRRRRLLMAPDDRYRLEQNHRKGKKRKGGYDYDQTGTQTGQPEVEKGVKESSKGHKTRTSWFGRKKTEKDR